MWSRNHAPFHSSLVDGVENAAIVCCFISSNYEQEEHCQLELQYAHKRGKRVILFILCHIHSWQPSPWLKPMVKDLESVAYVENCLSDINLGAGYLLFLMKKQPLAGQIIGPPLPEQPSYLYELVKLAYKLDSRIERFMNPSQSFLIEESYINLALVETKEHQEKERQLRNVESNNVAIDKFEEIHGTKTRIDIKDIFKTCKNNENKVLVLGRAGIGKSTFCRYVAHQWAYGAIWSEYDLVALVPLRSLTEQNYPTSSAGDSYDLIDVLRKTCSCWNRRLSEKDENLLQRQFGKIRILWLLDGYDELMRPLSPHLQNLVDQLLRTPDHIVTSRPYQNTLSYKVRMEIIGFTDENIPKYITQFFNPVETESSSSSSEEKKLIEFLRLNPRIWGIAHTPINLELICSIWSNTDWSETKTMTITMLYEELNEWLFRRYLEKQRRIVIDQINLMDRQGVYQNCKPELALLESLAFRGMEQNYVILPPRLLTEAGDESQCSLSDHPQLLNIGLLKSLVGYGTESQVGARKDHYFVHLSFQEYFAARYLIKALHHGARQRAISFIRSHKYNRRFILLFRFASGFAVESNCSETVELFWDTMQHEPIDLIGIRHIQLLMTCFDEVLHKTELPNHERLTSCTQHWIEHLLGMNNVYLQEYLSETLQSCISIKNAHHTQDTFIRLIEASDHSTKIRVLRLIWDLQLLRPADALLNAIVSQLETGNVELKKQTLETLASLGEKASTPAVIDRLVLALGNEDPQVRSSVCEAFQWIGEKAGTPAVIDRLFLALVDEDLRVRSSACKAVGRIGEKAATPAVIDRLVLALDDDDSLLRSSVCEAFQWIGEMATTPALIDRLFLALGDDDPVVRWSARRTVGRIGQKAATTAVIDRLVLALGDDDPQVRSSACSVAGSIDDKAVTPALTDRLVLALGDEDPQVRSSVCEAVQWIGEKAATPTVIDRLVLALGDDDPVLRSSVCKAFQWIGEKAATSAVIDRLVLALGDDDPQVRSSACRAVGSIGEKAATPAVIDRLVLALGDEDAQVRSSACTAVGRIGEKAATSAVTNRLVLALGDDDPVVRSSACWGVGKIGEKVGTNAVIDRLVLALGDEDPVVRSSACWGVGRIGEKAATPAVIDRLVLTLGDEDSQVRSSACTAIGRIGEKAATPAVIDRLVLALGDEEPQVRSSVCEAFQWTVEKAATPAVIYCLVLALGDDDPQVRSSACSAVGRIGERARTKEVIQAVVSAMQLSQDWEHRGHWDTLEKLLNLRDVSVAHVHIGTLLKHWLPTRDVQLLKIMWPLSMMVGAGITVNVGSLLIYNDADPEIIEVVDARVMEQLVKKFTSQARNVLGLGCWRFSRGLKRNRDGTIVDSSRENVS